MLKDKRIIITGAGSGIGKATSMLAAKYGAKITCVDLSESVEQTATQIRNDGGGAIAIKADISAEESVIKFVDQAISEFGGIDGIYANAGVPGGGKPFTELTVEDWQRTLNINTVGVFLAVKHTVPHFTKQGSGALLATASVAGLRANAGGVDYSASKAAVISIVQTVAYQLYGTGIRINGICPGLIETGMTKPIFERARDKGNDGRIGQLNPTARYGNPTEIGEMACFLLSDRASYVNGQAVPVDGGLSASHPWVYPRTE